MRSFHFLSVHLQFHIHEGKHLTTSHSGDHIDHVLTSFALSATRTVFTSQVKNPFHLQFYNFKTQESTQWVGVWWHFGSWPETVDILASISSSCAVWMITKISNSQERYWALLWKSAESGSCFIHFDDFVPYWGTCECIFIVFTVKHCSVWYLLSMLLVCIIFKLLYLTSDASNILHVSYMAYPVCLDASFNQLNKSEVCGSKLERESPQYLVGARWHSTHKCVRKELSEVHFVSCPMCIKMNAFRSNVHFQCFVYVLKSCAIIMTNGGAYTSLRSWSKQHVTKW